MEGRSAKLAITAALAGLIIAATIVMGSTDRPPPAEPAPSASPDKVAAETLKVELARCNRLGPGDPPDQACLDAWAEARRHFFGGKP